jgi:glycolate oxidase FAD binding subunit
MTDAEAPADEAAISAIVAAAAAERTPLRIAGLDSKRRMLRPVQAARTLSTRNLAGITLYSPQELIVSARAGTPLAEVTAMLAQAGQHLIAEPPDFSALLGGGGRNGAASGSGHQTGDGQSGEMQSRDMQSLGGVIATNLSGPRRVAWGAMRDHVMGVRAVNGTGEVIHSGGRVLKNVTGLDLCKLLTGSHGTLGVLTEITLKVLPAPEASASVLISGLAPAEGVAALSAALGSPYGVSAAAFLPAEAAARARGLPAGSATLVRLEDFAASVAYRGARLRDDLARFGAAVLLPQAESVALWRLVRDAAVLPAAETDAIWRLSVRPSAGAALAERLERAVGAHWFLDWGGGLVWIAAPGDGATHDAVSAAAAAAGGVWTVLRAPETLRIAIAVVPPEPPALAAITRRVKAAMDPAGILNPGRLYPGL